MLVLLILGIILLVCFGLVVFRGAPYVPTLKRQRQQAFDELYKVTSSDVVVDLGSGDGSLLRHAADKGAKAIGYELNPLLVLVSKFLGRRKSKLITTKWGDFWFVKLPPETTLVYVFINGRDMKRLERYLRAHVARSKRPLTIISYSFRLPPSMKVQKTLGPMHLYKLKP